MGLEELRASPVELTPKLYKKKKEEKIVDVLLSILNLTFELSTQYSIRYL